MVVASQNASISSSLSSQTKYRPTVPTAHKINTKAMVRRPKSSRSSGASADDTPLFMAMMPVKNSRRSLSPISNCTPKRKSRQSEPYIKVRDDDLTDENIAWDMINREISEWQKVCENGRPKWSPMSKLTQRRAYPSWQEEIHHHPIGCMHLDQCHRPELPYNEPRRAVTDSYLTDNNKVQDLAHLIAVQLLGACFTLSPEHIPSYGESTYQYRDSCSSSEIPKTRLISSLRMHTQARHSPSFGYQARNTSPAYCWHGAYDGPSLSRPCGTSSDQHPLSIEASRKLSRKKKTHDALHLTEYSATDGLMDNHTESNDIDPKYSMNTRRLLNSETDTAQRPELNIISRKSKSYPSTPNELGARLPQTSNLASGIFRGDRPSALPTYRYSRTRDWRGRETLQSVIRSEPHHIYMQPVKEVVVKRWQTIRRPFGYSLGYVHHDSFRRDANARSSTSASPRSRTAEGSIESPVLSSDGRKRRRQILGKGDVHINSLETNPRYNTPVSAAGSEVANIEEMEKPSPEITPKKGIEITEAISHTFEDSVIPAVVTETLLSKTKSPSPIGSGGSNPRALNSPSPPSTRRHSQRRHHRSNLSEICTPEEIEEISLLSGPCSPLTSPKEESSLETADELPDMHEVGRRAHRNSPLTIGSRQTKDERPRLVPPRGRTRRPSVVRTSTSGIQVFTPNEDGIELDGLPMGDSWDERASGTERKEWNFL